MVREAKKEPLSPRLAQHASVPQLPPSHPDSNVSNNNNNNNASTTSRGARAKAVVLKAWAPSESGSRLVLKENDVVEILSFESSEWCRVQLGRTKGAVPTSNLRALPASGRIMVALYDFESEKPGHLPFRRDEHVTAFEQVEGWMRGYKGTRFGRFPVTYVRELNAEEEEEQVLLMGLQADSHRPATHHRRSRGNRPGTSSKANASDSSDSDDGGNKQLATAIFRPDSTGHDSDSDSDHATTPKPKSKPLLTKSVTSPALPLPPKSPPPVSLSASATPAAAADPSVAAAAASAISAVLEGGDADISTLPPSLAANISKLKTRTSDVRRRSAELHELESTLRAQSESQEAQSGQQRLRVKALESRSAQLDEREAQLNQREAQLDKREHMLIAREEALRIATAELRQRTKAENAAAAPALVPPPVVPSVPPPITAAPPLVTLPPPPPLAHGDGEDRRTSISVAPPPLPEDDEALSGPPPLPDEPSTLGGGLTLGGVAPAGLPTQMTVPIEQYLPMREKQGWSVQPPLPPHCESASARAVHDAAAASLYGETNAGGGLNRDDLRAALDELLAAIGGGVSAAALERVRDAALRVIPLGAAAGRDRDDVLRGMRCVVENVVSVIVFGELIAANVDAADAQMAYATSSANASDMMDRLRLMLGVSDAHQQLKLNVSERVTSARRQSFVTVMKAMPVEHDDDDAGDDDDDDARGGEESEFDKYARTTEVGRFFSSIIEKHGARFPAVQQELTNKLPTLVKDAHVTTVEQLMALDKNRLAELKFTSQLTLFVQQLAKKHLASKQQQK